MNVDDIQATNRIPSLHEWELMRLAMGWRDGKPTELVPAAAIAFFLKRIENVVELGGKSEIELALWELPLPDIQVLLRKVVNGMGEGVHLASLQGDLGGLNLDPEKGAAPDGS